MHTQFGKLSLNILCISLLYAVRPLLSFRNYTVTLTVVKNLVFTSLCMCVHLCVCLCVRVCMCVCVWTVLQQVTSSAQRGFSTQGLSV